MPFQAGAPILSEELRRIELAKKYEQVNELEGEDLYEYEDEGDEIEGEDLPPQRIIAWHDLQGTSTHKSIIRDYSNEYYIDIPEEPSYYHYLDMYHRQNQGGRPLPDVPVDGGEKRIEPHLLLPEHDLSRLRRVPAWINHGRWIWECPRCNAAYMAERLENHPNYYNVLGICVVCRPEWLIVEFPDNWMQIEDKLMEMEGQHLDLSPAREWRPGWTMKKLQERNDKASEMLRRDPSMVTVRSLSIGATRRWSVGEHLTSANMILYISNILDDLAGRNGMVEFEDNIKLEPTATLPTTEGELAYMQVGKQFLIEMGVSGVNEQRRVVVIPRNAFTDGAIVYLDNMNESGFSVVPPGADGQTLTMQSGIPVWQ